jgi:enamine deaminase RidA (YjgF/YER057c/UK114 family)
MKKQIGSFMSDLINSRIRKLGITLPPNPIPSANYVPYVRYGDLVQLAGVAPTENGVYAVVGKVGHSLDFADGVRAARICALNALSNLKNACGGDLDRVKKIMMVRGFVNASEGFMKVPQVMNGASDLFISIFGDEIGTHARTSIGCSTMPSRVAVELDCLVVIDADGLS